MGRYSFIIGVFAPTLVLFSVSNAFGDEIDSYRPKAELSLGVFLTDNGTDFQLDSETLGVGTPIDFERDLDLNVKEAVFRGDGYWRFGNRGRHRVDGSFFSLSRDGSKTIDLSIKFGDETFSIAAEIETEFDVKIFKADYTYMIFQGDHYEVGASIGTFVFDFDASIREASLGKIGSSDLTVPLPTLGLRGNVEILPKLVLKASGDVFALSVGKYDGTLYDVLVGLDYNVTDHIGIGVGYNYVDMDVNIDNKDFDVDVGWTYKGALVYLKFII